MNDNCQSLKLRACFDTSSTDRLFVSLGLNFIGASFSCWESVFRSQLFAFVAEIHNLWWFSLTHRFIAWSWRGFAPTLWWSWWLQPKICFWLLLEAHCTFFQALPIPGWGFAGLFPTEESTIAFVWGFYSSFQFTVLPF